MPEDTSGICFWCGRFKPHLHEGLCEDEWKVRKS
jgi:hypothetical protein